VLFESPGSVINEEEKDISLPDNISKDIQPMSGRNSSQGSSNGKGFYLRGALQEKGINIDFANNDIS